MSHDDGERIHVESGHDRASGYDVIVRNGALADVAARVTTAAPAAAYAVITPHNLAESWGARVAASLAAAGLRTELIAFDDGEPNKTRATWGQLTDRMLALRLGRDTCVVAVGGGVTGDVAGFVAATYMRGVPVVQVPTTVLAMIDAAIGGKTGVDTMAGKNLVGAFHSPALVIIDPATLHTLPDTQIRAGLAEAVKHGAILDAGYFGWIRDRASDLVALDGSALEHLVVRSVQLKADVVSEDPHESGRRAILNFGHTVAHAQELYHGFGMPHGFAVAAGMCVEAALGEAAGITRAGTAAALADVCTRLGLPTAVDAPADALIASMAIDKKSRDAQPHFVLLHTIGECARDSHGMWTHQIDTRVLRDVLRHAPAMSDLV